MFGKRKRQMDAVTSLATQRGNTGGLIKRIDENRELLELMIKECPQFVTQNSWVIRWIRMNDHFFTELREILQLKSRDPGGRPLFEEPREWPDVDKLRSHTGAFKKTAAAVTTLAAVSSAQAHTAAMSLGQDGGAVSTIQWCFYIAAGVLVLGYLAYIAYVVRTVPSGPCPSCPLCASRLSTLQSDRPTV